MELEEKKFQFLIQNVKEIISLHDKDGVIIYISPFVKSVLGYDPEELLGTTDLNIIHPDHRELMQKHIEEGLFFEEEYTYTYKYQHKNGDTVWLELFTNTLKNENGEMEAVISTARNVTQKINRENEIVQMRAQIASDFHDELGNKLAGITLSTKMLSTQMTDYPSPVQEKIARIERDAANIFERSKDFIWTIDPTHNNLFQLTAYLKDFADEFLNEFDIQLSTNDYTDLNLDTYCVTSGLTRQVIYIIKEALSNAVKHSGCSQLWLNVNANEEIIIELIDNGKGFSNGNKHGMGITNMKKRAESIRSTLNVSSHPAGGTIVGLRIPL